MHIPVLLKETVGLLNVRKGGRYVDATLGLGGHSLEILRRGGEVLGIDADEESLEEAKRRIMDSGNWKIEFVCGNFRDIDGIAEARGFVPCDGVVFDLGMSSWQLEESGRGFSFQSDEPLDMRMDRRLAVTASDLLNGLGRDELAKLFQKYGEEQFARRIASAVVRARSLSSIRTTGDLVRIIEQVKPPKAGRAKGGGPRGRKRIHPATKVFQALRIAVNDEINSLRTALPRAFKILDSGGRLAVISFHSLEDREVKHLFRSLVRRGLGTALTEKPLRPTAAEVADNPRARSAKLRVIEKI